MPNDNHPVRLGRRSLLRTVAGVAAASIVGGAPLIDGDASYATVADSEMFYLPGAGGNPVWKKSLHANWVMQSFAYDNVNQRIYFAQTASGSTNGDLWITRTDTAGNETGSMALHGFGHGVQIAVEPYQGQIFLWTEWMASASGYGTKIGRFPFVNGGVLANTDSSIQDRTPSIDESMTNPQPAIDPSTDRLLVRFRDVNNNPRIVAFTLADARAGNLAKANRLTERALPIRDATWAAANPFQGFTAYGQFAYLLEGGVSTTSYITTIDLNDVGHSIVVDRFATTAGKSLPLREPEGMAIWLTSSGPRLAFGFESNDAGTRQASVFYKSQLVPAP